ncbi:IS3 family transposase [Anaerorhabdus sp.]|uniref:IS3 family transposase n=1 Tax=Anaerorhabdus sp. TaxID=1872524 RepID=UPI002FCC2A3D
MCNILGIARASYYKWLNRKETKEEIENRILLQLIQEYDERFNHILGYRRMTRWINKFNRAKYSKRRIRRLMKLLGIKSIIRRKKNKYGKTTPEVKQYPIEENKRIQKYYLELESKQLSCVIA